MEGYVAQTGFDWPGSDYLWVDPAQKNLQYMVEQCNQDCTCGGFNSAGWFKTKNWRDSTKVDNENLCFYERLSTQSCECQLTAHANACCHPQLSDNLAANMAHCKD
jgi:hypothetical protein